jgi:hypothetical protein
VGRTVPRRGTRQFAVNSGIPVGERKLPVRRVPAGAEEDVKGVSRDVGNGAPLKATGNGLESGIRDEVELRGDVVSADIADQADRGGMGIRKPKELAAARPGFPFRDLLAILQAGIEHIDRAAKDTCATKIVTARACAAEELNRSHTVVPRNVVIEPGGVRQGKRPEAGIVFFGPMDLKVQEHRPGAGGDGTDGSFSVGILVMSTNS